MKAQTHVQLELQPPKIHWNALTARNRQQNAILDQSFEEVRFKGGTPRSQKKEYLLGFLRCQCSIVKLVRRPHDFSATRHDGIHLHTRAANRSAVAGHEAVTTWPKIVAKTTRWRPSAHQSSQEVI